MNPNDLSHFKTLLLAEKESVTKCLQHQKAEIDDTNSEVLEPLTDSEEKLLEKIELALLKIENASYGVCVNCSREISRDRLEAKPSVSLCLSCQSEHESS
ncbi:MAG: TraR/DksA C4-type zinc finger protein [Akkermansiaceae bacterium]|jgi:DnaK suppressor protein